MYKLRQQLGVTASELADLVGLSLSTLQSNENGRRGKKKGLSPEIVTQIERSVWAVLDETQECWIFKHSHPPERITPKLWEAYRRFISEKAPLEVDREAVKMRTDALFEHVPKEFRMRLYWRLQDCLEECRVEFGLKNLEGLFEASRDEIHFDPGIMRFVKEDGSYDSQEEYTFNPLERFYRPAAVHLRGKNPQWEKELKDYLQGYYEQCVTRYHGLCAEGLPTRSEVLRLDLESLENAKTPRSSPGR